MQEMLAGTGTGFRSRSEIGRTALAMVNALLSGKMDEETAQQVVWEIQKALPKLREAE